MDNSNAGAERGDDARAGVLLRVVQETLLELHREPPRGARVTLDSTLDRDLGLDSLARVELLLRVERAFGVTLPENTRFRHRHEDRRLCIGEYPGMAPYVLLDLREPCRRIDRYP